jgi:hypothetical protein
MTISLKTIICVFVNFQKFKMLFEFKKKKNTLTNRTHVSFFNLKFCHSLTSKAVKFPKDFHSSAEEETLPNTFFFRRITI